MTEREEAIEKIAQEEVYKERIGRDFVSWPSRSIRHVHMNIAEKRYDARLAADEEKKRRRTAAKEKKNQEGGPDVVLSDPEALAKDDDSTVE